MKFKLSNGIIVTMQDIMQEHIPLMQQVIARMVMQSKTQANITVRTIITAMQTVRTICLKQ